MLNFKYFEYFFLSNFIVALRAFSQLPVTQCSKTTFSDVVTTFLCCHKF